MNRREFLLGGLALGLTGPLSCSSNYEECEFLKCKEDILYFARKYLKTNIDGEYSREFLTGCSSNDDVVLEAYRMSGNTTLCQVYAIWKSVFNPNQMISFVSLSRMNSTLNNRILVDMVSKLPKWMISIDKNSFNYSPTKKIMFENGSVIYTVSETEAMQPGYNTGNMMILDEFAFFKNQREFIGCTLPVLKYNRGQLVIASTPYGCDDLFQRFVSGDGHMKVVIASSKWIPQNA